MAIMGWMGYRKRTGFMAGLTVAQISEFSIVFVALGINLGHVGVPTLGLVTLVGLVTILLSTYMILYSAPLYERVAPWLGAFERRHPKRELAFEGRPSATPQPAVLVVGLGRYGARLLARLRDAGIKAAGVDFDPENVRTLRRRSLPAQFGDGEDPDFLETLPLASVRWVVGALPQAAAHRALLHALRAVGYRGRIAVVARDADAEHGLPAPRVDMVLRPFEDAADHAARQLTETLREENR
jgi:hypothetical protein